jgi:adenylate kinase
LRLVLLGAPGAGKGTQAQLLAERFGLKHVSTGALLRAAIQNGTELGRRAKEYMDRGELVPDQLVLAMVRELLRQPEYAGGFILDGFPRTVAQAEALDQMLTELGMRLDRVVNIDVPSAELVARLAGRRVCKNCPASYHLIYNPPRLPETCDQCGSPLVQRPDDSEATVLNRLAVYERQTRPLIDYYRQQQLLVDVAGSGEVEDVYGRIKQALGA